MENERIKGDPGADLSQHVLAALRELDFPRDAHDALLDALETNIYSHSLPTLIKHYEFPEHLEEFFTLRNDRYQIYLISGIQETKDRKSIGFAACEFPLMSWELAWAAEGRYDAEDKPAWIPEMGEEEREDYLYIVMESDIPLRFYFPIIAEYFDDPFNNQVAYNRRRQAIVSTISILYKQFGFRIRFTESGDIPREIQDEWLCPEIVEDYNDYLEAVERKISDDPNNPKSWYEKGGLLLSRDRSEKALECLKKACVLEPESPQIWFLMSDAFIKLGREKEARIAEHRAKAIQLDRGMPKSRADIWYLMNPMDSDYSEIEKSTLLPEKERLVCEFCQCDFIYVKDHIWYACNGCGREGAIKNASLEVELSTETQNPGFDWIDILKLDATFMNKTYYPIDVSTEDMELYFEAVVEDDEDTSLKSKHVAFTKFPKPFSKVSIEPREKIVMEAHLKDFPWEGEDLELLVNPGKYVLLLFVVSTVHTSWGDMESVSESNVIEINIPMDGG